MRALVTGARGFVGTWLTAHLVESGDDVVAIDHEVDITDGEAVRGRRRSRPRPKSCTTWRRSPTWAGRGPIRPRSSGSTPPGRCTCWRRRRACPHPPRVLLTSSAEVYGAVPQELLPVTEDAPLAPVTPYAASKVAAEYLGLQAHLAYGLPVLRTRPFNHVGPGQSAAFVVSALAERIVEARRNGDDSIVVGNLTARRDLTDVRDVVRAYRLLAERGMRGRGLQRVQRPGHRHRRRGGPAPAAGRVPSCVSSSTRRWPGPSTYPSCAGDPTKLQAATGWEPRFSLGPDTARRARTVERSRRVAMPLGVSCPLRPDPRTTARVPQGHRVSTRNGRPTKVGRPCAGYRGRCTSGGLEDQLA